MNTRAIAGQGLRFSILAALLGVTSCVSPDTFSVTQNGKTTAIHLPPEQPAKDPPSFIVERGSHGDLALGRRSRFVSPGALSVPPEFTDEGDALIHRATGVRLPKIHDDCRLAVLAPIHENTTAAISFAHGAIAEYDCRPSEDLTYVAVAFEGGFTYFHDHGLVAGLDQLASDSTRGDSDTPGSSCLHMIPPPDSTHTSFTATQCGTKWVSPKDVTQVYGSATVGFAKGSSFIVFLNTCKGAQCTVNRPKFGHFVNSFDLSTMRAELAPAQ